MGQLTLLGRRVVQPTREWGMVATSRSHAHVMLLLKQSLLYNTAESEYKYNITDQWKTLTIKAYFVKEFWIWEDRNNYIAWLIFINIFFILKYFYTSLMFDFMINVNYLEYSWIIELQ